MSLPPRAIDELSREPVRTQGWYGELLMFSGTLLFIAILVYVGIAYGYKPYLERQVADLNTQIATFSEQIPEQDQQQFLGFYSQLVNTQRLLAQHVMGSGFFNWLESNTSPNVYYTKLDMNTANNQVGLAGTARTMGDIAAELAILEGQPQVQRINFGNASANTNGTWQFNMTLFFSPGFFGAASSTPAQ